MSTLTKQELINQIKNLVQELDQNLKDEDLQKLPKWKLSRHLSKLKSLKALRGLSDDDLRDMAANRLDGTLGQQRNKGVIIELLRRGRRGEF